MPKGRALQFVRELLALAEALAHDVRGTTATISLRFNEGYATW
jgi:hypothetical protein